jgi:hypothetical protein
MRTGLLDRRLVRDDIEWFWSSVPIVAKHHARRLPWAPDEATALWTALDDIAGQMGQPATAADDRRGRPPTRIRPLLEELDSIRGLAARPPRSAGRTDAFDWVAASDALIAEEHGPTSGGNGRRARRVPSGES